MFKKKSCKRCGKKIDKGFSYCPYCGSDTIDKNKEEKDYGFLGKRDIENPVFRNEIKMPFGFNTIFKKLMKEMDSQFRQLDRELGKEKIRKAQMQDKQNPFIKKGGISINISSGAGTPVIKVRSFGNMPEFREMEQQIKGSGKTKNNRAKFREQKINGMSEEKAKKLASLPRQEAESKVRRLSGKVIYEIEMPDVKNAEDVIVNQLENSIEVKAFAKDKAYFKFLPVNLPLINYKLSKGKLILELGEE